MPQTDNKPFNELACKFQHSERSQNVLRLMPPMNKPVLASEKLNSCESIFIDMA